MKPDIEKIAEKLWDKWALNWEDHIFLTKDLFLLALQDEILLYYFIEKIADIQEAEWKQWNDYWHKNIRNLPNDKEP